MSDTKQKTRSRPMSAPQITHEEMRKTVNEAVDTRNAIRDVAMESLNKGLKTLEVRIRELEKKHVDSANHEVRIRGLEFKTQEHDQMFDAMSDDALGGAATRFFGALLALALGIIISVVQGADGWWLPLGWGIAAALLVYAVIDTVQTYVTSRRVRRPQSEPEDTPSPEEDPDHS